MEHSSSSMKLGLISKFILFFLSINYIGQLFKHYYYYVFSNIPLFTVLQLEIWRVFTGFFTSGSLYEFAFNFFITLTIFNHWENKEGTSKHSVILLINLLVFQTSMLMLYLILVWFFPIVLSFSIKALPSLGIALLVKHLLLTDTKTFNVYPGLQVNDRLLIVVVLFGFVILCGIELRIEMLIGFYYGFLMCKFPKFYEVEMINEEMIAAFEKSEKYKAFFKLKGWILLDERYSPPQPEKEVANPINHIDTPVDAANDIQADNKIEIVEDTQANDTIQEEANKAEPTTEGENDFVDLSLEDPNFSM